MPQKGQTHLKKSCSICCKCVWPFWGNYALKGLTLSWRRFLSNRNQPIDLLCKSMDWFLYGWDLRHERLNVSSSVFLPTSKRSFMKFLLFPRRELLKSGSTATNGRILVLYEYIFRILKTRTLGISLIVIYELSSNTFLFHPFRESDTYS